jgi:hypothetical protein
MPTIAIQELAAVFDMQLQSVTKSILIERLAMSGLYC